MAGNAMTRNRFDHVDICRLTIVELEQYMADVARRRPEDPFLSRAYDLRIAEIQAAIQRELSVRNRRLTEELDGLAVSLSAEDIAELRRARKTVADFAAATQDPVIFAGQIAALDRLICFLTE